MLAAAPVPATAPCDKCYAPVDTGGGWATVACLQCETTYLRCEACGGKAGARRSMHSHRALKHPAVRR